MKISDYLIKIFKIINKFTILEKAVFLLLIILIIMFLINLKCKKEGFKTNSADKELIKRSGTDIFDDFYVDIYDDLVYNNSKNTFEVEEIINIDIKNNQKPVLLDIGCGTGHHINRFNKKNISSIGIDISPAMIKKAKENYPDCEFKVTNALNSMEFNSETFTHITCLYFTIYYIKDKQRFFENCFNWLTHGGVLVIHLVDMKQFDPILPISNPFIIVSPQNYAQQRITESIVKFDTMDYKSKFELDGNINSNTNSLEVPNAVFKEVMNFKDSNKRRINEHKLYMQTQKSILSIAKTVGFIFEKQEEMVKVQYENNYLYTLRKP